MVTTKWVKVRKLWSRDQRWSLGSGQSFEPMVGLALLEVAGMGGRSNLPWLPALGVAPDVEWPEATTASGDDVDVWSTWWPLTLGDEPSPPPPRRRPQEQLTANSVFWSALWADLNVDVQRWISRRTDEFGLRQRQRLGIGEFRATSAGLDPVREPGRTREHDAVQVALARMPCQVSRPLRARIQVYPLAGPCWQTVDATVVMDEVSWESADYVDRLADTVTSLWRGQISAI